MWQAFRMPDLKEFIACWQKMAKENGLPGIHFVALWWSDSEFTKESFDRYNDVGIEAINPAYLTYAEDRALGSKLRKKIRGLFNRVTLGNFGSIKKFDYKNIIPYLTKEIDKEDIVYPTILSGYDRTARSGAKATIYYNYTPELFSKHIKQIIDSVQDKPFEHRIVFLKSWNEWAEGNYVEPDQKYGHGYLDALRDNIIIK